MKRTLSRLYWALRMRLQRPYAKTYSQCGEDVILAFLADQLGIKNPSYFDIGAHEPFVGNNTYRFYAAGGRGVCVEPNPALAAKLRERRPGDTVIEAGVGPTHGSANYYVLTSSTLNTFSKEDAEQYAAAEGYGRQKIERILSCELVTLDELFTAHGVPDLVSLDIEGYDLATLRSVDFRMHRPRIWCIETARRTGPETIEKNTSVIAHMKSQGYEVYADTFVNTIFVDRPPFSVTAA